MSDSCLGLSAARFVISSLVVNSVRAGTCHVFPDESVQRRTMPRIKYRLEECTASGSWYQRVEGRPQADHNWAVPGCHDVRGRPEAHDRSKTRDEGATPGGGVEEGWRERWRTRLTTVTSPPTPTRSRRHVTSHAERTARE